MTPSAPRPGYRDSGYRLGDMTTSGWLFAVRYPEEGETMVTLCGQEGGHRTTTLSALRKLTVTKPNDHPEATVVYERIGATEREDPR